MLRIFRQVRQEVLAKGQFKKYVLYALGEITLIVVGILIALAIDNGNEQAQTRDKEQIYLVGLENEFRISKQKLENLMAINAEIFAGGQQIIAYIDAADSLPGEDTFSRLLFKTLAYDISFNPNNSLLVEMINSGSLKDVYNAELRAHLVDWNARLMQLERHEADLQNQRNQVIDLLRSEEASVRRVFEEAGVSAELLGLAKHKGSGSNRQLLRSRAFENNMLIFLLSCKAIEQEHYLPLLEELKLILTLIRSEVHE